jgi:hypothetical protein
VSAAGWALIAAALAAVPGWAAWWRVRRDYGQTVQILAAALLRHAPPDQERPRLRVIDGGQR